MQPILVHRLRFRSYDHLFLTNAANSCPLFSAWRNAIANALGNFNKYFTVHVEMFQKIFNFNVQNTFIPIQVPV
jgi:hypothetical protein